MDRTKLITLTIIFFVSLFCLGFSISQLVTTISAKKFPKTNASVIYTGYKENYWFRYTPKIKYKYKIDSTEYVNNTYNPTHVNFRLRSELDAFLENYKEGTSIQIHYNPDKPQVSYIRTTIADVSIILLIIGLGFLYVGISISKQKKL